MAPAVCLTLTRELQDFVVSKVKRVSVKYYKLLMRCLNVQSFKTKFYVISIPNGEFMFFNGKN